MSQRESDALVNQIYSKYKTSWEQTRIIASSFGGGEGIKFPWDDEKDELEETNNAPMTPEEIQAVYNRYLESTKK